MNISIKIKLNHKLKDANNTERFARGDTAEWNDEEEEEDEVVPFDSVLFLCVRWCAVFPSKWIFIFDYPLMP